MRSVFIVMLSLSITSCALPNYGPVEDPTPVQNLSFAFELGTERILFSAPGNLNTSGYGLVQMNQTTAVYGGIAVTDNRLIFAAWNEPAARYSRLVDLSVKDIAKIERHYRSQVGAVVVFTRDSRQFTFSVKRRDSPLVDIDGMEAFASKISMIAGCENIELRL